jgi:hypothetical protein
MKKHNTSRSVRPIDALLQEVAGGSTGSRMLAGMATGAATGTTAPALKAYPSGDDEPTLKSPW